MSLIVPSSVLLPTLMLSEADDDRMFSEAEDSGRRSDSGDGETEGEKSELSSDESER